MEVGGHHIIFMSHTDDIRVGEVGIQHRVGVSAVTLVTPALGVDVDEIGAGIGLKGSRDGSLIRFSNNRARNKT